MRRLTLAVVLASAVLVAGVATADTTVRPPTQPTVHEPQHSGSHHGSGPHHSDTHHGSHGTHTDCDCPHHEDEQTRNHEDCPRHEHVGDRSHGTNRR